MIEHLVTGFQLALTLDNLLLILAGTVMGVFVGAMPGLSSTIGLAILLPFTFPLDAVSATLMMVSLYMAAEYGGSITAIAVGIPGTPPAMATVFDGYPLAQKGEAGQALGVSILASTLGGMFGIIVLILALGPISKLSLAFGPVQYFALGVFGLSIVGNLVGGSLVKGFISVMLGLLFYVVGLDVLSGFPRLTLGTSALLEGIELVPAMIGFFAIAEAFKLIDEGRSMRAVGGKISGKLPTWPEFRRLGPTILRSSAIGTGVGAVPGAGATIASMIAWNEAKRLSKTPERFGTGVLEGVAAPESANNASVGGALIPLLTLGIPGSGSTAVLLGALMVHGMNPGPLLATEHPELIYAIYAGLFLAALCMLAIGLLGVSLWVRVIAVPNKILTPVIVGISLVGAYALGNSMVDVGVAIVFGVLGYLMLRFGFPIVPAVLALVLGFMVETNYRRALSLSSGSHLVFVMNPVSLVLLLLAVASFAVPIVRDHLPKLRRGAAEARAASGDA
ncbi:MAG: tripartite tricarboxylate transporter permease [Gemmatimonadetes bacterium]|nr:tripartite tricarboxylate transporter permease [Gemmatimonadota bacterium]